MQHTTHWLLTLKPVKFFSNSWLHTNERSFHARFARFIHLYQTHDIRENWIFFKQIELLIFWHFESFGRIFESYTLIGIKPNPYNPFTFYQTDARKTKTFTRNVYSLSVFNLPTFVLNYMLRASTGLCNNHNRGVRPFL